jgi:hypothetical protein
VSRRAAPLDQEQSGANRKRHQQPRRRKHQHAPPGGWGRRAGFHRISDRRAGKFQHRRADRSREHVPAACDGSNQLLRIVHERAANFQNALGQRIVSDSGIWPDSLDERGLAHHPPVMLHQVGQGLEHLGAHGDLFTTAAQKATIQVQSEVAEGVQSAGSRYRVWLRAAHGNPLDSAP